MMTVSITTSEIDRILATQLTVAWAGEGCCQPPRLGWWRTDLVDPMGGGDLLGRLLPSTHRWASLEAVREAAVRVDRATRSAMADHERLRTLYFLGFEIDELLNERLAHHKRSGAAPEDALPLPLDLTAPFDATTFAAAMQSAEGAGAYTVVPGGRQVKGQQPAAPLQVVQHLATALVPLADQYPLPFFRIR